MKGHAPVGDALIFMTKAVGVLIAILIVAAGALWWDQSYAREVSLLRVKFAAEQQKVEEQQITIADLGEKLNRALVKRIMAVDSAECTSAD